MPAKENWRPRWSSIFESSSGNWASDLPSLGGQYPLEVSGKDYRLDLLFYHFKLHCFVVIDLKMGEFKPEYAGKMNFYLSAVDDLLKDPADRPTIGLILCKGKDRVTVEYALRDSAKPLGIC